MESQGGGGEAEEEKDSSSYAETGSNEASSTAAPEQQEKEEEEAETEALATAPLPPPSQSQPQPQPQQQRPPPSSQPQSQQLPAQSQFASVRAPFSTVATAPGPMIRIQGFVRPPSDARLIPAAAADSEPRVTLSRQQLQQMMQQQQQQQQAAQQQQQQQDLSADREGESSSPLHRNRKLAPLQPTPLRPARPSTSSEPWVLAEPDPSSRARTSHSAAASSSSSSQAAVFRADEAGYALVQERLHQARKEDLTRRRVLAAQAAAAQEVAASKKMWSMWELSSGRGEEMAQRMGAFHARLAAVQLKKSMLAAQLAKEVWMAAEKSRRQRVAAAQKAAEHLRDTHQAHAAEIEARRAERDRKFKHEAWQRREIAVATQHLLSPGARVAAREAFLVAQAERRAEIEKEKEKRRAEKYERFQLEWQQTQQQRWSEEVARFHALQRKQAEMANRIAKKRGIPVQHVGPATSASAAAAATAATAASSSDAAAASTSSSTTSPAKPASVHPSESASDNVSVNGGGGSVNNPNSPIGVTIVTTNSSSATSNATANTSTSNGGSSSGGAVLLHIPGLNAHPVSQTPLQTLHTTVRIPMPDQVLSEAEAASHATSAQAAAAAAAESSASLEHPPASDLVDESANSGAFSMQDPSTSSSSDGATTDAAAAAAAAAAAEANLHWFPPVEAAAVRKDIASLFGVPASYTGQASSAPSAASAGTSSARPSMATYTITEEQQGTGIGTHRSADSISILDKTYILPRASAAAAPAQQQQQQSSASAGADDEADDSSDAGGGGGGTFNFFSSSASMAAAAAEAASAQAAAAAEAASASAAQEAQAQHIMELMKAAKRQVQESRRRARDRRVAQDKSHSTTTMPPAPSPAPSARPSAHRLPKLYSPGVLSPLSVAPVAPLQTDESEDASGVLAIRAMQPASKLKFGAGSAGGTNSSRMKGASTSRREEQQQQQQQQRNYEMHVRFADELQQQRAEERASILAAVAAADARAAALAASIAAASSSSSAASSSSSVPSLFSSASAPSLIQPAVISSSPAAASLLSSRPVRVPSASGSRPLTAHDSRRSLQTALQEGVLPDVASLAALLVAQGEKRNLTDSMNTEATQRPPRDFEMARAVAAAAAEAASIADQQQNPNAVAGADSTAAAAATMAAVAALSTSPSSLFAGSSMEDWLRYIHRAREERSAALNNAYLVLQAHKQKQLTNKFRAFKAAQKARERNAEIMEGRRRSAGYISREEPQPQPEPEPEQQEEEEEEEDEETKQEREEEDRLQMEMQIQLEMAEEEEEEEQAQMMMLAEQQQQQQQQMSPRQEEEEEEDGEVGEEGEGEEEQSEPQSPLVQSSHPQPSQQHLDDDGLADFLVPFQEDDAAAAGAAGAAETGGATVETSFSGDSGSNNGGGGGGGGDRAHSAGPVIEVVVRVRTPLLSPVPSPSAASASSANANTSASTSTPATSANNAPHAGAEVATITGRPDSAVKTYFTSAASARLGKEQRARSPQRVSSRGSLSVAAAAAAPPSPVSSFFSPASSSSPPVPLTMSAFPARSSRPRSSSPSRSLSPTRPGTASNGRSGGAGVTAGTASSGTLLTSPSPSRASCIPVTLGVTASGLLFSQHPQHDDQDSSSTQQPGGGGGGSQGNNNGVMLGLQGVSTSGATSASAAAVASDVAAAYFAAASGVVGGGGVVVRGVGPLSPPTPLQGVLGAPFAKVHKNLTSGSASSAPGIRSLLASASTPSISKTPLNTFGEEAAQQQKTSARKSHHGNGTHTPMSLSRKPSSTAAFGSSTFAPSTFTPVSSSSDASPPALGVPKDLSKSASTPAIVLVEASIPFAERPLTRNKAKTKLSSRHLSRGQSPPTMRGNTSAATTASASSATNRQSAPTPSSAPAPAAAPASASAATSTIAVAVSIPASASATISATSPSSGNGNGEWQAMDAWQAVSPSSGGSSLMAAMMRPSDSPSSSALSSTAQSPLSRSPNLPVRRMANSRSGTLQPLQAGDLYLDAGNRSGDATPPPPRRRGVAPVSAGGAGFVDDFKESVNLGSGIGLGNGGSIAGGGGGGGSSGVGSGGNGGGPGSVTGGSNVAALLSATRALRLQADGTRGASSIPSGSAATRTMFVVQPSSSSALQQQRQQHAPVSPFANAALASALRGAALREAMKLRAREEDVLQSSTLFSSSSTLIKFEQFQPTPHTAPGSDAAAAAGPTATTVAIASSPTRAPSVSLRPAPAAAPAPMPHLSFGAPFSIPRLLPPPHRPSPVKLLMQNGAGYVSGGGAHVMPEAQPANKHKPSVIALASLPRRG